MQKDRVCKVHGIAAELIGDEKAFSGADIANQLCQAVLIEIHDNDALRFKTQHSLDEAGADGTGTAYHTDLFALDFLCEFLFVCFYIGKEHAFLAESNAIGYEFVEVEHIL